MNPHIPFKPGDLVRIAVEPPGFEGTVYTVAGIWPGNNGWVQLQERQNAVGYRGLRLATDAKKPSDKFPLPLPDPDINSKRQTTVEHHLSDGGLVRHWNDDDGRVFCQVCEKQETMFK